MFQSVLHAVRLIFKRFLVQKDGLQQVYLVQQVAMLGRPWNAKNFGYKETISEIENQIENENILQYIREKYKDNLSNTFFDSMPYNYADWNKALAKYSV